MQFSDTNIIIGTVGTLTFLIGYLFRIPIYQITRAQSFRVSAIIHAWLGDVKLRINDWRISILLPIISTFIFNSLFFVLYGLRITDTVTLLEYPLKSLYAGLIGPIFEQFIQCAILLGFIICVVKWFYKRFYSSSFEKSRRKKIVLYGIGLVISAYTMMLFHGNQSQFYVCLRFFSFLLYGGLYLISDKNLFPSIVAHSVNNILTFFIAV
jgi:hypothetical protein